MDGIELRTAAGAFLAEALGWPGGHAEIGENLDLAQVNGDEVVYATEIETDDGPAPILIFCFALTDAGRARRAVAVETMLEAAAMGTPGPRIVAEGEVDEFGLLLATTPGGLAILTGEPAAQQAPATAERPAASAAARGRAADALMDALREANERAAEMKRLLPPPASGERSVEERALSLYLLDPSSLGDLMAVMRRVVEDAAREQGAGQPK